MIIHTLYDQGTAGHIEDMSVIRMIEGAGGPYLIAAVLDGVSGLYYPAAGPQSFSGRTGGQLVCEVARNAISAIGTGDTLESLIGIINQRIREFLDYYRIPIKESDILPGAAFVLVKIDGEKIQIIQGADCFAVWQRRNGNIGATRNQVFLHDLRNRRMLADLMIQHNGDRQKVWEEFTPTLAKLRLKNVNRRGGYALLNGQEAVYNCCRRVTLPKDSIKLLILGSDGIVPFSDTQDRRLLGKKAVRQFNEGGLKALLQRTRDIEDEEQRTSHIHHPEATGIAIEL